MESVNNKTFTPLQAGRAYIGLYEKVDAYSSCVLSIISDQNCLVTMYQSQNKTTEYSVNYSYTTPNVQYTMPIQLTAPYVYFVVRNEGSVAQTYLNFTIIYKTAYNQTGATNIFDSNGNTLLSDGSGNLGVKLDAVDASLVQSGGIKAYITNGSLPFSPAVQRATATLWNASSITTGAMSANLDCSAISSDNISIYGTTSGSGTITVRFSADNTTFYQTQYSSVLSAGEFGFSIPMSAPYVSLLWTGGATTITAIASAS